MARAQKNNPGRLLSIIVPVYKQERTIQKDIQRITKALSKTHHAFEIIIVVDGNVDRSLEKASRCKSRLIKVVGYETNHGKGYAVRYGMVRAKGDLIGFIDAGMDLNPAGISLLLDYFQLTDCDIVVGSKLHKLSKVRYPWQRKVLSWGYRTLVRVLFGLTITDTQVGLKVFKRKVLEDVFPRLLVKRYAFDIEVLAVAYRLGYQKIYAAPIDLSFTGWSSITSKNFWKEISHMLWDTCAVFYRIYVLHYYDNGSRRKWRYDPELNFKINVID